MPTIPKEHVKSATIPAVRLPASQVQRIKKTATAQRKSVSQYIRDILLANLPPIASQSALDIPKLTNSETEETAGRASEDSQSTAVKRTKKCKAHGIPKHQCVVCQNIGY